MYLYLFVRPLCIFTCLWGLDMAESECGGEVWSPGVPTSYSTIPTHHNLNFQNNYKLENGKCKYKKTSHYNHFKSAHKLLRRSHTSQLKLPKHIQIGKYKYKEARSYETNVVPDIYNHLRSRDILRS